MWLGSQNNEDSGPRGGGLVVLLGPEGQTSECVQFIELWGDR